MNYESKVSESSLNWSNNSHELSSVFLKAEKYYKEYISVFSSQEKQIIKSKIVTSCLWLNESRYLNTILYLHSLLKAASILVKNL